MLLFPGHESSGGGVQVFAEPLCRRYSVASRCSCAYLFATLCLVLSVVLPILLVTSQEHEFWIRKYRVDYEEQPDVSFNHKALLVLHTNDETTTILVSTVPAVNALHTESVRMSTIRTRGIQTNPQTQKNDAIWVNVLVPLHPHERIHRVEALLFFDYGLSQRVPLQMESMAYMSHDSALAGAGFTSHGTLQFQQSLPLTNTNSFYDDASVHPIWDLPGAARFVSESRISTLVDRYFQSITDLSSRPYSTVYRNEYPLWTLAPRKDTKLLQPDDHVFNFTAVIRIPHNEPILYIPTFRQVAQDAFLRYLPFAVVVGYLFQRLLSFVFFHQLVDTKLTVDGGWHS